MNFYAEQSPRYKERCFTPVVVKYLEKYADNETSL